MLPPGPPGDPLVGHLLRMPSTDSALVFHEWAKKYGDVMRLEVLGRTMIILDSYQAATDLLEKRGAIYSDRPKFTVYELLGWDPSISFLSYGKRFNKQRTMHQSYLNRNKAEDFKVMQTQEARTLVQNLFESTPDNTFPERHNRFATGTISQIVAGHRITSNDDPYLHMSHMIVEAMSKTGTPGGSPVDFFPILQHFPSWFPGASHMGVVRACRPTVQELYEYPFRTVKNQQESGEAEPSFILQQLEAMDPTEDDIDLKGAAATMFGAGEITTWGAVSIFFLAMILHPEYQVIARKEIDSVVGDQRLPEFEDRKRLPIVECILQETLRRVEIFHCIPHRVMDDDVYRGMLIPKGSLVIANIRGMSLNESVYSDPTRFYPERFLPKPAGRGEPYFNNTVFGFGRRICTGQYVAENSLWVGIASILASCKINNAVDETGNIIVPDPTLIDGLISHPKDTRCIISPRSPGVKKLIREALI
ncbi:cytochrome P450 [Mycena albidolilacea]|uniref:Cytochrome P450 n=1 Tax=Mycena albidolilacea TaxID=1033008 RepID=A0AAD7EPM1_9AGAR|nr:cytochrome P450 [Mycena albidolilacea]